MCIRDRIPAGVLGPNQSYARVSDGAAEWEVKGGSSDKYVTPSTNNQTLDSNAKMEKFEEHDSVGIGTVSYTHLTTIETPISGSPLSSMIVPFTVFVCVTTCTIVLETPSSAYTEYDRGADNKDSPKIMEARL